MVLEQIFKTKWLEKKPRHAFGLGILYSIIGIISAIVIFPKSAAIMSVAFTSILLVSSLNQLLQTEENVEIREKKLNIKQLFKDHKDIFEIYIFLFIGIFLTFATTAIIISFSATESLFSNQLAVAGLTGSAINISSPFFSILVNNLIVLLVCFVLSLIYGAGSILFITWNASVWGIIFGYISKISALGAGTNPIFAFGQIFLPAIPHFLAESVAYFCAAIIGGVVSKAVIREKLFSKKFHHIITDALIFGAIAIVLIILAALLEVTIPA
ncbi:hypothetical protein HN419_06725 [Candidatus Woesearchaeota archaeon]|jgi:uncharacterized membrane protein SpoIIM required for sporulation|nr:hypothetical protein [Candidatus Woesearchaeota archaeon]MBT3538189.1 hypothetical protein [Candidatus Woesearchaeota archaeon]MBT4697452.1 hypothetical protein [Candidatus Woesearchaeota archaeon]MBT4716618.1 hypothetical protein [Candidatus Woesearchaeota archaeon]MBT7105858.1 hypothetical protein [Candidatus Woesearchaeota archaeon]